MITAMTMVDRLIGSAPFIWEGDFAAGIARAAQLGYDGVEIHVADPAAIDQAALADALKRHNIIVTAFGTGRAYVNEGLSLIDPDPEQLDAAIGRMDQFLELGGRFGAKVIVGCMRGNVPDPKELPAALDKLADSMQHVDKVAGDNGVSVVFEPINRYENNFLCDMNSISEFIRERNLRNTGMLIDTFHMNIEEADMLASIRSCAPEIQYVHIADSNRRYPGEGHTDILSIIRTLKEVGYEGALSAECLPWPDLEGAQEGWIREVKQLLDRI